ncbi:phage protein NinX family protein [Burkholderia cepacia]|uniref:phage protein NinX family protein n=1 Tax=Burkholderia cepacia TaxID=292 RepID=UPI00298F78F6|nr:phage protein NinX family protein [Burkholderia cepacia]
MLDYWVARADGLTVDFRYSRYAPIASRSPKYEGEPIHAFVVEDGWAAYPEGFPQVFAPSKVWDSGGPIIEREGISVMRWEIPNDAGMSWTARNLRADVHADGPTPLIAGMRAFVASKFGDEVKELAET